MTLLLALLTLPTLALPPALSDAVSTGDCAAVRAALPNPVADDERLAVGWCLVRQGEPEPALPVLEPLQTGPLAGYARLTRARALVSLGRASEAVTALDGLVLPGPAGLEARALRGRALVLADRSLEARPDLRALLGEDDVADEARYWLAVGGERRGDKAAAIATYRVVWAKSVRGPWSERAAERLAGLGAPVPDASGDEARDLVKQRVDALRRVHRHDDALKLLLLLREKVPATTTSAKLDLARSYARARDYPTSTRVYAELLGEPEAATGSAALLFDYALGTSRAGDYDAAATIYGRLVAQHPQSKQADEASFKLGYLEYDRRHCDLAASQLRAHVEARPESAFLDDALWFLARCLWRSGDLDGAVAAWSDLAKRRPASALVPGARYWMARAAGRRGDVEAERAGLEQVLRQWPTDGYAWFAAFRLGRRFPQKLAATRPPWPTDLASHPAVVAARALEDAGFDAWARAELEPIRPLARARGRQAALAAAWAFIGVGDYTGGRALAAPYCDRPWADADPIAQQACTPRPEAGVVNGIAARYGFDPLVPYGIMTTESALDPSVTSIAGARGLMQLMPVEAERIHRAQYGDRPYDPDDLYAAPYNASLGTAELGMKARALADVLLGTSLPAAIASYNGGEQAVRRWLSAWEGKPEFDEFAEDIGYTETRRYVKRVLGYTMVYRWVYGDPG